MLCEGRAWPSPGALWTSWSLDSYPMAPSEGPKATACRQGVTDLTAGWVGVSTASLNPTLVFPTGSVRQRFHGNRRRSTLQTGPSHPGLPCTSLSPAGSMGAAPGLLLLPLEGPAAGLSPGPELTPPSQSTAGSSLAESVRLDVQWGRASRCQNASEKTLFLRVRDRLG